MATTIMLVAKAVIEALSLHLKYLLFFSIFNHISIFLTDFSKNAPLLYFRKISPLEAELIHGDGQTDGQTQQS